MRHWDVLKLDEFLACHPKFRIVEISDDRVVLAGEYHLKAQFEYCKTIERTYNLKFICPRDYPNTLPKVFDESDYFPRSEDFHTYDDSSFCLGSELKIKSKLKADRSLETFFGDIVDPFLYAVSHHIEFGIYPYGELAHGEQGLVEDYEGIFGLKGKTSVIAALRALGMRKRDANKLTCPCGCGLRLGRCNYRFVLQEWRNVARRRWYREHLIKSFTPLLRPKKSKNTSLL